MIFTIVYSRSVSFTLQLSQILGHSEQLYIRLPRGLRIWQFLLALMFTIVGLWVSYPFPRIMDFPSVIPAPWSYYNGNGKIWLQYSHVVSVYSIRKISPNTTNTIFNALFYLGSNHTCHSLNYCD